MANNFFNLYVVPTANMKSFNEAENCWFIDPHHEVDVLLADKFSVFQSEIDGPPSWIADFADQEDAEGFANMKNVDVLWILNSPDSSDESIIQANSGVLALAMPQYLLTSDEDQAFIIREGTDTDRLAITRLVMATQGCILTEDESFLEELCVVNEGQKTSLGFLGKYLVGVLIYKPDFREEEIDTFSLYVDEDHRRKGFGRELLRMLFTRAAQDGLRRICVHVAKHPMYVCAFLAASGMTLTDDHAVNIGGFFAEYLVPEGPKHDN